MKQNPVAKDAGNVFISFCWHKFIIVLTGLPIFITRATPMAAASKALSSGGSQRRHIHSKRQLVFVQGQQRTVWNGSTAKEGKAETEGCNGEDNGREMVNFKRRDLSMKLKYYHVASVSHNHFFQKKYSIPSILVIYSSTHSKFGPQNFEKKDCTSQMVFYSSAHSKFVPFDKNIQP